MKNLIELLKVIRYRKQIIQLLRYSFDEVQEYRYLTTKEKQILRTEREFYDIKSL
jgi:hypothetical protein